MKVLVLIFVILFFFVNAADASEIFGRISTDPRAVSDGSNNGANGSGSDSDGTFVNNSAVILKNRTIAKNAATSTPAAKAGIKVLGSAYYPNGTLLRGPDKRIYRIEGDVKKYIANLNELAKFRGQAIIDVASDELAPYKTRGYVNGELIREKRTVKVYVIKEGRRRHVLNLDELRKYYFGLEIYNISREEMALYE